MTGLVTLTARMWKGPLPVPGSYLKAERGRTAFLIVEIVEPKRPCGYVARFRCERHSPQSLPKDARIHVWEWSPR